MRYALAIDLGTTIVAAAVHVDGRPELVSFGTAGPEIPSVLWLGPTGEVLVGRAAERRAIEAPSRVAREFKRRVGDPTPLVVGGAPVAAESLMAELARWVVDRVTEQRGESPEAIGVCCPANWVPYRRDVLRQALAARGLPDVELVEEPAAVAVHYAAQGRLAEGETIAVYDLGGGTFDVALLRRAAGGWEFVGSPSGIERLGGIDFDAVVLEWVLATIRLQLDRLPDEPETRAAVARLREDCRAAKVALSEDPTATIAVFLPGRTDQVRLTRREFEDAIRPSLSRTVTALEELLERAGLAPGDLRGVVLAGGSSSIPLVSELVTSLGCPVTRDSHPKHATALGAARIIGERALVEPPAPAPPPPVAGGPPPPPAGGPAVRPVGVTPGPSGPPPPGAPRGGAGTEARAAAGGRGGRRTLVVAGAGLALAGAVAVGVAVSGGGGSGGDGVEAGAPSTTAAPATTAASVTTASPGVVGPGGSSATTAATVPPTDGQPAAPGEVHDPVAGASPGPGPAQLPAALVWRHPDDVNAWPLLHDGTLFLPEGNGDLVAVDPATGAERWSVEVGFLTSGTTDRHGDMLAVGNNTEVVLLDATDGTELRRLGGVGGTAATPAVSRFSIDADLHLVIFEDGEDLGLPGLLVAFEASSGEVRWTVTLEPNSSPLPPQHLDGVVVTPDGTDVLALDAATGAELWRHSAGDFLFAFTVADGVVVVPTSRDVTVLDLVTGEERWQRGSSVLSPAVDGGVLFTADDGAVVAYELATGDVRWRTEMIEDAYGIGNVGVDSGQVYVPIQRFDSSVSAIDLFALDRTDGTPVWDGQVLDRPAASFAPIGFGGNLFLLARDGTFHAVG